MTDKPVFTDEPTLTDHPTLGNQPAVKSSTGVTVPNGAEDFLSTPAEKSDDLELMLAARPPRRKLPKATLLLATAALLGAGFAGGIEAQKHLGSSSSSSSGLAAFASALRGAEAGAGGSGSSSSSSSRGASGFSNLFGGGETVGTVLLVDGSTVYVTSSSGGIVKVSTTPATTVDLTQSGTLAQLKPGDTVVVRGSSSKGTVSATSISEGSAGGGGF